MWTTGERRGRRAGSGGGVEGNKRPKPNHWDEMVAKAAAVALEPDVWAEREFPNRWGSDNRAETDAGNKSPVQPKPAVWNEMSNIQKRN